MNICSLCETQLAEDSLFCPRCGAPTGGGDELLASSASDPTGLLDQVRKVTEGEFTIVRELGRGGMGRVYLAQEIALERRVAMKVLPPSLAEQRDVVERFQREARTAGKLSHPNIVHVYQVIERGGFFFFTMPYVAGPNLRQILRTTPKLEPELCRRYLQEAAGALAYAHRRGVVHRDIKPENMLMEGSRDGRLMLTDFGIAKALGTVTTLTQPGDVMGTPYYMSPEQCEQAETIDGRSDQYSLGLVAYEMLAGKFPFSADSLAGIVYKHLHEYPESLDKLRPDVPLDVRQAIGRSIRKRPQERFDSMGAMLKALGAPTPAIELQQPVVPRTRKSRRLAWMGSLVLAAATISAAGFAIYQRLDSPDGPGTSQLSEIDVPPVPAGGSETDPIALLDTASIAEDDTMTSRSPGDEQLNDPPLQTESISGGDQGGQAPGIEAANVTLEAERRRVEQARDAAEIFRQSALDAQADSVLPDRLAVIDERFADAGRALEANDLVTAALGFLAVSQAYENLAASSQRLLDDAAADLEPGNAENAVPPDSAGPDEGTEPDSEATTTPVPPETAIRDLIENYRLAVEAEDTVRLAAEVYRAPIPEPDGRLFRLWFDAGEDWEVTIALDGDLDLREDAAEVRIRQNMKFRLSATRDDRDRDISLLMSFGNVDGVWRVVRIEQR
jgi:serine/threonine protein kinase